MQIKDMVLKLSGLQCKGGASSSGVAYNRYKGRYDQQRQRRGDEIDHEDDDGHYNTYLRGGSSSSTPAWEFAGGGKGKRNNDQDDVVIEDEDDQNNGEPKEWTALVEPGVQITFLSLPAGSGNDLKRIRFSREMFNKWQAQRWWGENLERIMELYNVQRFSRQALPTPPRSDDGERESFYSRVGSTRESPVTPPFGYRSNYTYRAPSTSSSRTGGNGNGNGNDMSSNYFPSVPDPTEHILPHHLFHYHAAVASAAGVGSSSVAAGMDASRTTTSSRDEAVSVSASNASDADVSEWVEQDEPGVYITIRELPDGTRELRRVRFSRERFGEVHAKLWWEDNRERIQAQYL